MAIKYLELDDQTYRQATLAATVRLNGTTGVSATIVLPRACGLLNITVPALSSCTFKVTQKAPTVGATLVNLTADIDGNAYPRASYTGNDSLMFPVFYGATVVVTASATGGMLRVQGRR